MDDAVRQPVDDTAFLTGGEEMGALMREYDWSASPLGPVETWPQSLKVAVRLLLNTRHPMFIWWGPELIQFYNDAYRASLGPEKHPSALGSRGRDTWPEIWDLIGPQISQVMAGGEATWHEDQLVPILRHGGVQDVWWTYGYSPIDDEAAPNGVGGVLVICRETTTEVLSHRETDERYRALFSAVDAGFCVVEVDLDSSRGGAKGQTDYRVLEANPAFYHQTGFREEILGQWLREAAPALEEHWYELYGRVARIGKPMRFEQGSLHLGRWFDVYAFRLGEPKESRVAILFNDISARRATEAALRASEEFNRRILASSADCIKVLDLEARLEFMSEGGMGVMEVDDFGTIEGKCWPDFWQGERHATAWAAVDEAKRGGTGRFQGFATTLKGSPRWWDVVVTPIAGADGKPEKLLSVSRDVTATREAEERLRELNETLEQHVVERTAERNLLARIVETTDAFIQVLDLDYRFLAVNKACADEFERIYGVRPKVGDTYPELLADRPEELAAVQTLWGRALAGEEFTVVEDFGDPDRGRPYYEIKFNTLRNEHGERIGAYQFVYDVTERLRNQERLRQTEAALRQSQKMEAVGQLTGGLAHDFNNLLTGISGSLEMMATRVTQGRYADVERYVGAAQVAARRAAALTHRLLAFSRRQTLAPKVTDVNALVSGMEELIRRTVGPEVVVESVTGTGVWPVEIDPNQLENALLNLAINARDAMPDGGTITIETANRWMDARAAREQELGPGQYVSVSVSDTGSGMAPEVVARAFDPFFTTKPLGVGTGLGLSMVYGFARQSGGQVRIYSEVGQGTRVSLYLPRHLGEPEGSEVDGEEDLGAALAQAGETVLVIDDEPVVRMLVADVLEELGYAALEARDGPEGLKVLQSKVRVDLLITDVGLPGGLNGRQVADAARTLRPDLKVLFITGYAENAVLNHGHLEHGMQVVTKPFAVEDLARRIRGILADG